ncbi:MAG: hypothetical protein RIG61_08070 [Deltaproteobacteria bacterium]
MKTTKCEHCGYEIGMKIDRCPNCGERIGISVGGVKRLLTRIILLLIALYIIYSAVKVFDQ